MRANLLKWSCRARRRRKILENHPCKWGQTLLKWSLSCIKSPPKCWAFTHFALQIADFLPNFRKSPKSQIRGSLNKGGVYWEGGFIARITPDSKIRTAIQNRYKKLPNVAEQFQMPTDFLALRRQRVKYVVPDELAKWLRFQREYRSVKYHTLKKDITL